MKLLALLAHGSLAIALVASPDSAQAQCQSLLGNQIVNCGFETGDPPATWEVLNGEEFQRVAGGSSGSYSGRILPEFGVIPEVRTAILQSNCFAASGRAYRFGASFRRSAEASCRSSLVSFEGTGCQGESSLARSDWIYIASDEWTAAAGTAFPEGQSAHLVLFCEVWTAPAVRVLIDDAFAGPVPAAIEIPAMGAFGVLFMLLLVAASGVFLLVVRRRRPW